MAKVTPFKKDCSSKSCKEVGAETRDIQLSRGTTYFHSVGGLGWTVLKPAEPRNTGKIGMAIQFKRCHVYEYTNKNSKRKEKASCTKAVPTAYSIPQATINCYHKVNDYLARAQKKKGTGKMKNKVLTAVACRSALDQEPMTPMLISAVIGGNYNTKVYTQVRRAMYDLVSSGRVKVTHPTKRRKTRLKYIGEEEHRVPTQYLGAFREFVTSKGPPSRSSISGMRKLFGKEALPTPKYWYPTKGFRPDWSKQPTTYAQLTAKEKAAVKKTGYWSAGKGKFTRVPKTRLEKFEREQAQWAARTGLAAQMIPIKQYRWHEPTREEVGTLGGLPTERMRKHGFI